MYIRYLFEDVIVNEPNGEHTRPVKRDVEHDFHVNVSHQDIIEYLMPKWLKNDEKTIFNCGIGIALCELDSCNAIDYDQLENNTDFVEFMRDRYREEAIKDFEESNEPY